MKAINFQYNQRSYIMNDNLPLNIDRQMVVNEMGKNSILKSNRRFE